MPELVEAFPLKPIECVAPIGACLELKSLLNAIDGRNWRDAPQALIRTYPALLEQLSGNMLVKLLPAWLHQATSEPNGHVARWLVQYLGRADCEDFSQFQREAVLQTAANLIHQSDRASTIEGIADWSAIKLRWSSAA